MQVSHRQAVVLMVAVTLMWSIAGVVTRFLEAARGFEITFWRSAVTAVALVPVLAWMRGPRVLLQRLRTADRAFWISSVCWAVMFSAFMLALSLTTVANVLITLALAPLFTALASRIFLHHQLPPRTWIAIAVAGLGIAWMYGAEVGLSGAQHVAGVAVALGVPIAGAANWTLMQHLHHGDDESEDMLPAVMVGAWISALTALPLALPLSASAHDVGLLALLGIVQLAIPCLLAMWLTRVLKAPEISLLALLEVVFGVLWAWVGAGESPSATVLGGGALVLAALVGNEVQGMRERAAAARIA